MNRGGVPARLPVPSSRRFCAPRPLRFLAPTTCHHQTRLCPPPSAVGLAGLATCYLHTRYLGTYQGLDSYVRGTLLTTHAQTPRDASQSPTVRPLFPVQCPAYY